MKVFKRILLLIAVTVIIVVFYNYPKLNIIAGYSSKSTASSVYVAGRSLQLTDSTDNNFHLVELADDTIDEEEKSASASVFGLLTRKAVYRQGVGAVLTTKDFDPSASYLQPNRVISTNPSPFPYGQGAPMDSVFANVDYVKLNKHLEGHFQPQYKTRGVLVLYKGHIIAEKYADGFTKDSRFLGWSMTKSLMSTVYGIMQYQGKIDVQKPAPIQQWQNDDRKNITIHNLLQMNSGLEWDENYDGISDVTKMLFLEEDMTQIQKDKPLVGKPNETWNYSSGTSNLLSGILRQELGSEQEYLDYWYREFIDKIGMNSMILETDMAGNYVASSYSWATARDWAKFGWLYVQKGNWNGEQLFAEDWADYVTTPTPSSNGQYGAQFWLNDGTIPDVPMSMFYANGHDGQRVYILPEQDLVIARFGLSGNFSNNKLIKGVLEAIE
jgi:CubicO group peptidase (beta-lactamase class C family)